jgi:cytochrome P450
LLTSLAFNVAREAKHDMVIDGLRIPKGTQVEINSAVIHHDRQIWGDDVNVFKVERWAHIMEGSDAASPYAYLAFSQGPRICPGRTFALAEMRSSCLS